MVLLLDADSIPYTVCHNKKDEPVKTLEDCIKGANSFLNSLCNATNADKVHLFFTVNRCFRYNIDANYKAKRTGIRPDHFYETRQYLIDNYNGLSHPDLEADDLLNIYKHRYSYINEDYIIYSKDKDVKNLIGVHYDIDNNLIKNVFQEEASDYFWKSMITGDTVDNIKGIPKKGIKYAEKLFEDNLGVPIESLVFNEYVQHFGENNGIEEFYKNYKCLHILNSYEGIEFQEPIDSKDIYARTLSVVGE